MKTLAMLGGMSYGATGIYYRIINEQIQRKLGGANSARILLHSFNHEEMSSLFPLGRWEDVASIFATAGNHLRAAGADGIIICCNIGHKVADEVERKVGIPLLHTADYTGSIIQKRGITKAALIGTKPVMEQDFFVKRFKEKFDIDIVVPSIKKRDAIHDMIFEELGANVFKQAQKDLLLEAIEETKREGAEGVVFACTELQFVVKPDEVDIPLWDTMEAHALGAAQWMLDEGTLDHITRASS